MSLRSVRAIARPTPGQHYQHVRRDWQKVSVEGVTEEGLVCALFLKSKERLRIPLSLFWKKFVAVSR